MKVIPQKKSNKKSNSCHMIHMGLGEKTASHICTYVTHTHMQCRVRGLLRLTPITTTQYRIRYNDQHRRLEATSMIETGVIKSFFFFFMNVTVVNITYRSLSCPVWQLMWSTYFGLSISEPLGLISVLLVLCYSAMLGVFTCNYYRSIWVHTFGEMYI